MAPEAALRAMSPDTDLLGFLDADDLSPEGRLARDVGVLRADPSIDLIYSKVRFFDREDTAQLAPSANSHVVDGRIVNLAAGVFRRGLLDRVGPFDETLIQAEDLDFLLRIFDQKPSFVLSDHVGVFYRKNHGSMTENRLQMRQEMMKALLRARMRKGVPLPNGIITADHMGELRSWVK
jgi:hypothetical protein